MNPLNRVRRALRVLAVAAPLAATAVLFLGSPAVAHGDGHHQVEVKQYMFMPMALTIEQGDTVTWTNRDTAAHDVTVTAGPVTFHSPLLAQGKSWSHTFTTSGSYSYLCSVHPEMRATVTVTAPAPVSRPTAAEHGAPAVTSTAATGETTRPAVRPDHARTQAQPVTSVTRQVPAAKPTLVRAPQSSATLQPLILVVGAAVAVVMFCLLLMASRPVLVEDPVALRAEPKHLEES